MSTMITFEVDDELFKIYLFYAAVLVIKVFSVVWLIGKHRFTKGVFASPEDTTTILTKNSKVQYDDVDVERVRRAHLNDLENIPFFIIICFGYLLTNPDVYIATNLIRLFVAARIIHTIVYAVVVIPQPARFLSWIVAYCVTIYMAVQVLLSFV